MCVARILKDQLFFQEGKTLLLLLTVDTVVSASDASGSDAHGFLPQSKKGKAQSLNWKDGDTEDRSEEMKHPDWACSLKEYIGY